MDYKNILIIKKN